MVTVTIRAVEEDGNCVSKEAKRQKEPRAHKADDGKIEELS